MGFEAVRVSLGTWSFDELAMYVFFGTLVNFITYLIILIIICSLSKYLIIRAGNKPKL